MALVDHLFMIAPSIFIIAIIIAVIMLYKEPLNEKEHLENTNNTSNEEEKKQAAFTAVELAGVMPETANIVGMGSEVAANRNDSIAGNYSLIF